MDMVYANDMKPESRWQVWERNSGQEEGHPIYGVRTKREAVAWVRENTRAKKVNGWHDR